MLYPLQVLCDFVFPPTKHELQLRAVSNERFIHWYHPHSVHEVMCLSEYQLPEVQAAIAACKFEHSYHGAKLLSSLIDQYLKSLPTKKTVLIPIPLSAKRLRERKFNQVERVLQYAKKPAHYHVVTNILMRTIETIPQTTLTRAKRLTNITGAFAVQTKNLFYLDEIERIIICDDVMTTGATLHEAQSTLIPYLPKNVEVICVAWAH